MSLASRVVIRWALVLLFAWFAVHQLMDPAAWVGYLPEWTGYLPIPGEMLIRLNGWMELIGAVLLALGAATRVVAVVLGVHLAVIALEVGGAVGVRDAALAAVTIALGLSPADAWTLDAKHKKSA